MQFPIQQNPLLSGMQTGSELYKNFVDSLATHLSNQKAKALLPYAVPHEQAQIDYLKNQSPYLAAETARINQQVNNPLLGATGASGIVGLINYMQSHPELNKLVSKYLNPPQQQVDNQQQPDVNQQQPAPEVPFIGAKLPQVDQTSGSAILPKPGETPREYQIRTASMVADENGRPGLKDIVNATNTVQPDSVRVSPQDTSNVDTNPQLPGVTGVAPQLSQLQQGGNMQIPGTQTLPGAFIQNALLKELYPQYGEEQKAGIQYKYANQLEQDKALLDEKKRSYELADSIEQKGEDALSTDARKSSDAAVDAKSELNKFSRAYDESSFIGPRWGTTIPTSGLGKVISLHHNFKNEQDADIASGNMAAVRAKILGSSKLTNQELNFAKTLKPDRSLTPEAKKDQVDFMNAALDRQLEKPEFINSALARGAKRRSAELLWDAYNKMYGFYKFHGKTGTGGEEVDRSADKERLLSSDIIDALNKGNKPPLEHWMEDLNKYEGKETQKSTGKHWVYDKNNKLVLR